MNHASYKFAAVLMAATAVVCFGQNHTRMYMDSGSERMLASRDVAFAIKAAQSLIAELQLGRLAVDKAQNPAIKHLAQRMLDDNTKTSDRLNQIAKQQDMILPANMNARDQAQYDRLRLLSGGPFDQAYMKTMLRDLPAALKAFFNESKKGKDAAIRNFAAQNFDPLEQRLAAAKSIQARLMSAGS